MKARLMTPHRLAAGLALLLLAACGRPAGAYHSSQASADQAAGYAAPPLVLSAQRVGDQVVIDGHADPDARLRLQAPQGQAFGGTAGADGGWSMPAPMNGAPAVYAVGEEQGDQILRAEGYVAAFPLGRPAALLRAGAGSLALGGPPQALAIGAVDYDQAGWAFVSGQAPVGASLRLQVDGAAPTEVKADAHGRFSLGFKPAELPPGAHRLLLMSPTRSATAAIVIAPAGPISGAAFQARREGAAWRVDWSTPGGGVQTSLILDP